MTGEQLSNDSARKPPSLGSFVLLSLGLHLALWLAMRIAELQVPEVELDLPQDIELGFVDGDPGEAGAPPPAAPAVPEPVEQPVKKPVEKKAPSKQPELASSDFVVDAGVPTEEPNEVAEDTPDAGPEVAQQGFETGDEGDTPAPVTGDGLAPLGHGGGLGFGAGGFGTGLGGPPGAVIGLHVNLARIRESSLILETSAMLGLIPEWLHLLEGSGLDALQDFDRIFVASPTLKRSALVVSGTLRGGHEQASRAAEALARERGKPIAFSKRAGMRVAPWLNRGPTTRQLALIGREQVVIARPSDVQRALAVAAALAVRHGGEPNMERVRGPGALLAMYRDEAVALSVEGVAHYVRGEAAKHAPLGLRLSLRHVDEFHAELRAYGYYASPSEARDAKPYFEMLRERWKDHPQARFLGLRTALEEATITHDGTQVEVQTLLTLHQVRYLLAYVSRALKPRGE